MGDRDFCYFVFNLGLFAKIKKDLVSTHSQIETRFTQELNKIKKSPKHAFVDIGK